MSSEVRSPVPDKECPEPRVEQICRELRALYPLALAGQIVPLRSIAGSKAGTPVESGRTTLVAHYILVVHRDYAAGEFNIFELIATGYLDKWRDIFAQAHLDQVAQTRFG